MRQLLLAIVFVLFVTRSRSDAEDSQVLTVPALNATCVVNRLANIDKVNTSDGDYVESLVQQCVLPDPADVASQNCDDARGITSETTVVSLLMWENTADPVRKVAEDWSAQQPDVEVVVATTKLSELTNELKRQAQERTSIYDGFIYAGTQIPDLDELGALEVLDDRIKADGATILDWPDVSEFFRGQSALYDRNAMAIPIDGDLLNVYYRRDLLEGAGFDSPVTWEDYLGIAEHFNGTDLNGDGEPDYGSCLGTVPSCGLYYYVTAMAVSMLQYNGTSQGIWVDPVNLRNFFPTPVMEIAYGWLQRAVDLGPPDADTACVKINKDYFFSGRCAITISWGDQLTEAYIEPSFAQGRIGTGALPGSPAVFDREARRMEPCNPTRCPFATLTGGRLVNNPPYNAYGGFVASINANSDPGHKDAMFRFLSHLASSSISQSLILGGGAGMQSFRTSHFENIAAWEAAGIASQDAEAYLEQTRATLSSPNIALEMRTLGAGRLKAAIDSAIADLLLLSGANSTYRLEVFKGLDRVVEDIIKDNGRARYQQVYQKSLGVYSAQWTGSSLIDVCADYEDSREAASALGNFELLAGATLLFHNCSFNFFRLTKHGNMAIFNLPNVSSIGKDLEVSGMAGNWTLEIEMGSLQDVGRDLLLHGNSVGVRISMNALHVVGGALSLAENPGQVHIMAEELREVRGPFVIRDNQNLGRIALQELNYAAEMRITGNTLSQLTLPSLQTLGLGPLVAEQNAEIRSIEVPNLQKVNGDLIARRNPDLVELAFAKLQEINGDRIEVAFHDRLAYVNLAQSFDIVTYCDAFSKGDFGENSNLLNVRTQWFNAKSCAALAQKKSANICPKGYLFVHSEGEEVRCDEDWRTKFNITLSLILGCIVLTAMMVLFQRAQFMVFYTRPSLTRGKPIPADLCGLSWDSVITTMLVSSVDLVSDCMFIYLQLDDDACIESKGIIWTSFALMITTSSLGLLRTVGEVIYLSRKQDRVIHFFPYPAPADLGDGEQRGENKSPYGLECAWCVANGFTNVLLMLHTVTGLEALKLLPWDRPTTTEGVEALSSSEYLPDWKRAMKLKRKQSQALGPPGDCVSRAGSGANSEAGSFRSAAASDSRDSSVVSSRNQMIPNVQTTTAPTSPRTLAAMVTSSIPWSKPRPPELEIPDTDFEASSSQPGTLKRVLSQNYKDAKTTAQNMGKKAWRWARTLAAYDAVVSLMEDVGQITLQLMFLNQCLPTEEAALSTLVSLMFSFLRAGLKIAQLSQDEIVRAMGAKVASKVKKATVQMRSQAMSVSGSQGFRNLAAHRRSSLMQSKDSAAQAPIAGHAQAENSPVTHDNTLFSMDGSSHSDELQHAIQMAGLDQSSSMTMQGINSSERTPALLSPIPDGRESAGSTMKSWTSHEVDGLGYAVLSGASFEEADVEQAHNPDGQMWASSSSRSLPSPSSSPPAEGWSTAPHSPADGAISA